ncbi:hypothetical protein AQF52_1040 [Streptomyces venezuelae]|nr:hypothetical protein AQF52_1040 [Streptomyces venezuelae]
MTEQHVRKAVGAAGDRPGELLAEPDDRPLGGLRHADPAPRQLHGHDLDSRAQQALPGAERRSVRSAVRETEEPGIEPGRPGTVVGKPHVL